MAQSTIVHHLSDSNILPYSCICADSNLYNLRYLERFLQDPERFGVFDGHRVPIRAALEISRHDLILDTERPI